ncbi:ImmA/IrrE family metallo-endopeptidase [Saccharomonospora xinjiangensis]|uniref:ImmA/IrrE family metallo-endopeptidase n=1 Tax=Saccharomonospora xinjiangensis TaxID=75294 RepID=UPI0035105E0D
MTTRVPVSPAVLEWAADRSGIDADDLYATFPWDEWLAGERQPTLNQLEKFANTAGVPFGYLLLDEPPRIELPIPDYREGFGGSVGEPSASLFAVLNQSIRRQEWYRGYAQENLLPQVEVVGSADHMSAVDAAASMRESLNFEVRERFGNWNEVRRHLVRSFEELGGLTVVTSMVDNNTHRLLDPEEFRGFSLVDEYAPLVFVNARQTLNGQIFTLAHEFAHVWRGFSGISSEDPAREPRSEVEQWCNAVASEFLVPARDLRIRYPSVARFKLTEQLDRLAQVYRCGTLVVLQAIRRDGLARFDDFDAVYAEEVRRLESLAPSTEEGRGNFYANQPYRIGERFSRAVISDALEGRTQLSEAMRLMSFRSLSVFDKYAKNLGIS